MADKKNALPKEVLSLVSGLIRFVDDVDKQESDTKKNRMGAVMDNELSNSGLRRED